MLRSVVGAALSTRCGGSYLVVRGAAVARAEDVDRARVGAAVVVAEGPDHDGVAGDRHGADEYSPSASGRSVARRNLLYVYILSGARGNG